MTMPDDLQGLLQLGFAAGVAGWLVRWMTTTQQRSIDKNTQVILNLQLYIGEMYRLLLLQDAQLRGLDLFLGDDSLPNHKEAVDAYQKTVARLDSLKASIEATLGTL